MTLFQYISIVPIILAYSVLSYLAFQNKDDYYSDYLGLWLMITFLISIFLPIIAFV